MKKFLLSTAVAVAGLFGVSNLNAQQYVDFDFYCFTTADDVSYDRDGYQRYYIGGLRETPADAMSETPSWTLQKFSPMFATNYFENDRSVCVKAAFERDGVMYVAQTDSQQHLNRLAVLSSKGEFSDFIDFPTTSGYIFHLAYVLAEDNVYFVVQEPSGASSQLYKAKGTDLANWELVGTICSNFAEKPYSFTYSETHNKFFYVSFDAKLYSMSLNGEKEYLYDINAGSFASPCNSDYTNTRPEIGSGLVWAEDYEMLLWCCPRAGSGGGGPGSSNTFLYGLPVEKSGSPVLMVNTSLGKKVINVMLTSGLNIKTGVPQTPRYLSCYYTVDGSGNVCNLAPKDGPAYEQKIGKGYYNLAWNAVREDTEGNPIEEEVYYDVRLAGENGGLLAIVKNPKKGITTGTTILIPREFPDKTFYVTVQARTSAGCSGIIENGPNTTTWNDLDAGGFIGSKNQLATPVFDPKSGSTLEIDNAVVTITSPVDSQVAYIVNPTESDVETLADYTISETNVVKVSLEGSATIKAYSTAGDTETDSTVVEAVYIVNSSAVEEFEAENGAVEVYTINGVRVTGTMAPGLYIIVRPGREASKIIVK